MSRKDGRIDLKRTGERSKQNVRLAENPYDAKRKHQVQNSGTGPRLNEKTDDDY